LPVNQIKVAPGTRFENTQTPGKEGRGTEKGVGGGSLGVTDDKLH